MRRKFHKRLTSSLYTALLTSIFITATSQADVIESKLQLAMQTGTDIRFIVQFDDKLNLDAFPGKGKGKGQQLASLLWALRNRADSSQASAVDLLYARGAKRLIQLWAINGLAATARPEVVEALAALPGVSSIRLDETLAAPSPQPAAAATPEWNLNIIQAPVLWNSGYDGTGTVVANMDTGVDMDHPDLTLSWRDGANSWFDPNGEHATPYDDTGHGTQAMSLIVGGDTGGTSIGVAPGAQWIAVKIFNDAGVASLSGIHQGFQWLLDPDGNPATNDFPDVVNNSWGYPNLVGQCYTEFSADIAVLKAAGIAVVFSAGNQGSLGSVSPGDNPNGFAVGAMDSSQNIDTTSSRGPSACDGSFFPEVVAPGVSVRTADLTFGGVFPDSYASVSGTSFAAPHVAGTIALLRQAYPATSVAELEQALTDSTIDLGAAGPDNESGYGMIDAVEANNALAGGSLMAVDDNYGIPSSKILFVEPFGVLENDTLDGENAGEAGVTVTLVTGTGPAKGVLTCPDDPGLELCVDGSFEYTPDESFDGEDTFQYQANAGTGEIATATVTLSACSGGPTIFSCWHETPYKAKLTELGYNLFLEGFEGTAWDAVRTPDTGATVTAPEITSKDIIWKTNHPLTNGISTVSGAARTGPWGGYDPEHGFATDTSTACDVDNPPIACYPFDGLSGSGTALHGVGGYFHGYEGANIAIILDEDEANQIVLGSLPVEGGYHFFGVIDTSPAGFTNFQFREIDGKSGNELSIWSDDFIIATTNAVTANNPPVLDLIGDKEVNENTLLTIPLTASDPDDGDWQNFSMTGGPTGSSFYDNGDNTATFIWRPGFNQAGSYQLNFTATDNGLPSASDSELITITVVDVTVDVTRPVITMLGTSPVNIELSTIYVDAGATATDDIDGNITASIVPTSTVDVNMPGTYSVTYNVSDSALNAAIPVVRTVNVIVAAGDINGNGTVGLEDMILALQSITSQTPPTIHLEADLDGDGRIGLTEAIMILRMVGGL